jgi:hypothetical protein
MNEDEVGWRCQVVVKQEGAMPGENLSQAQAGVGFVSSENGSPPSVKILQLARQSKSNI